MNLDEAIEALRRLAPEKQARIVRAIEEERIPQDVPRFLRALHDHPVDDWPPDLSEDRPAFTGRGKGL